MHLRKRSLRLSAARRLASFILAQYIRLVRRTGRWNAVNDDLPDRLLGRGQSFIVAFWHQRLMMMPYTWKHRGAPLQMLISQHRDGELISRAVGHFGIGTVAGSTGKGGSAASRAILKLLKQGQTVGITPDGPRGPCRRVSTGTLHLARLSGAPIVPLAYAVSRRRVLRSWDRFVLPLPFARGVFYWGDPIEVPRDLDAEGLEAKRRALEETMNRLTDMADEMVGSTAIAPDLSDTGPGPERSERAAAQ